MHIHTLSIVTKSYLFSLLDPKNEESAKVVSESGWIYFAEFYSQGAYI
ncbi:hypothetical protein Aazo_1017 ['Nostoc azollae' 0708]|jgi:hypothetical protein|uniref:Uncharacterized protein n=1 Tax=Nostoc azollae (strain 0708) TaxID=551115 RepID=D7E2K7_NOSA0|nr:hypothetical protein Aazo_1017 ['Nostoc azollae' 0708]